MMRVKMMFVVSAAMGAALLTGACAERALELWQTPHRAEGVGFGDNHRQVMAKHIVNPEPAKPADTESAVEAERLSKGMGDYLKGETGNVGGSSGGTGVKASIR